MSDNLPKPSDEGRPKRGMFWVTFSLLISTMIVIWSFTLPFRQPGKPLVSSIHQESTASRLDLSQRIQQRRSRAQEFRDASIALDRAFLRRIQEKNRPPMDLPGLQESRDQWRRREKLVQKQLNLVRNAKKGSLAWDAKQSLLKSLEDGPRQIEADQEDRL